MRILSLAVLLLGAVATPARAQEISAAFPFASRYVDVLGSTMHYIDEGEGDPILFLHGNPTSSYLWRNVIPHVMDQGRIIAPDLIGMGKSDKPDLDYTYADHIKYVEGFIEALELKNITFVVHDWGSALGLDYASRHEDNVLSVAFMEAFVPPVSPRESKEDLGRVIGQLRTPGVGEDMIYKQNAFVEMLIPFATLRELSEAEMDAYRAPFHEPASRKPTLVWPRQIPVAGEPAHTTRVVEAYGQWMRQTDVPMLHLYVSPGAINPPEAAEWLAERVKNIESIYIGQGIHYIQEDLPEVIGRNIANWRRRVLSARAGK